MSAANAFSDSISVPPAVKYSCPSELVDARMSDNFIIFAGSGISVPTERPDWRGLIDAVLRQCTAEELRDPRLKAAKALFGLSEDTVHRKIVPTVVKKVVGEAVFYRRLHQALEPDIATRAARYHNLLLNLGPRAIITTNYDLCFEMCTCEVGTAWSVKTVEDLALAASPPIEGNTIYHLHGLVGYPESIIVGLGDYTRLYRRQDPALPFLREVFENYTVLFVGCSLRDEEMLGELMDGEWLYGHHGVALRDSKEGAAFQCLGVPVTDFDTIMREDGNPSFRILEDILSDWAIDLHARTAGGPRRAM